VLFACDLRERAAQNALFASDSPERAISERVAAERQPRTRRFTRASRRTTGTALSATHAPLNACTFLLSPLPVPLCFVRHIHMRTHLYVKLIRRPRLRIFASTASVFRDTIPCVHLYRHSPLMMQQHRRGIRTCFRILGSSTLRNSITTSLPRETEVRVGLKAEMVSTWWPMPVPEG